MKKNIAVLLISAMALGLAACGQTNGGAAELLVSAEEHIETGLDGGDPVHTLMLVKPLILNRHSRVHHGFGNFIQRGPLAVGGGVDLLELLDIAALVYIIYKGSSFQIIVLHGPVPGFRENVILKIITQRTGEYRPADQKNQQNGSGSANGNLE